MGGMLTKALYQFSLQDTDTKELYDAVPKLLQGMSELPGFQDVTSDLLVQNPQLTVEINRDRASSLGITPDQIENTLYDAYGQRQISTIYTDINEYWVVMELLPEYQQDVDALGKLWVRSNRGPLVPLSTVAKFKFTVGPVTVRWTLSC